MAEPLPALVRRRWLPPAGPLPVANGTGGPEPVFTGSQWSDIRAAKSGSPNINVHVTSTTTLDGQELRGVVDQRIKAYDADTGRALDVGRYV